MFLASQDGRADRPRIGIDMTPAMIERAQANAESGGYTNVEFLLSTIDKLPLPDASVDCVISNCVLDLAPDKPAVFREIARVLRPGGRLAVRGIALKGELPEAVASSLAAYVGCIAGATRIDTYRNELLKAGFEFVEIVDSGADLNAYAKVENQAGCCSPSMNGAAEASGTRDEMLYSCVQLGHASRRAPLLSTYDVNEAAASVKVYAETEKTVSASCCGPTCCS